MQRVEDILDLKFCTDGVQTALQNEDYEQVININIICYIKKSIFIFSLPLENFNTIFEILSYKK